MDSGLDSSFEFQDSREESKRTITFGRVPSETVISLLQDNDPLIQYLESQLNVDIQFVFAPSYDDIIEGMSRGEYDFVLLGPYAYVLAQEHSDYQALVRRKRFGQDWYKGIIFSRDDEDIDSLSDLRGRSFAFVDPSSASGYLFPTSLMIEEGVIDGPDRVSESFQSMSFLGRHDRVVRAVYRGEFTAGAAFKDARTQSGLPEDANPKEELPIVAETRRIPTSPIAVRESFRRDNPQLTNRLTELLTTLHETEKGQAVLESLGLDRYIRSEEGDYRDVEEVREILRTDG